MIAFEELLIRLRGLERRELARWVDNRWVLPERYGETWVFHEVDVARVELIFDIRRDFAIDDEATGLVLGLLDQVYGLRRRNAPAVLAKASELRSARRWQKSS